jgi:hypothetical protein
VVRKQMASLRMSLVMVAKAADVSLSWVGLAPDPTDAQINFAVLNRDRGWNTICGYVTSQIDAMQAEIKTLQQMNKGLRADLDGMVAQQEGDKAVSMEWDTRKMLPQDWATYIGRICAHYGLSQFQWDVESNTGKKWYADKYDKSMEDKSGARNIPQPCTIAQLHECIRKHVEQVQVYFDISEEQWGDLPERTRDVMLTTYDRLQEGRI